MMYKPGARANARPETGTWAIGLISSRHYDLIQLDRDSVLV